METAPENWKYDDVFDALDLGCGQLLLEFRTYLKKHPKGAVLMLVTHDIASPMEIPAWSRLTGHQLMDQCHPFYLIKKKEQ